MKSMNITLPDSMIEFIEQQVAAHESPSASDYFRDLVRADQKRHAKEQLEQVLLSAINSGDPVDVTQEMVEEAQQRLRNRST